MFLIVGVWMESCNGEHNDSAQHNSKEWRKVCYNTQVIFPSAFSRRASKTSRSGSESNPARLKVFLKSQDLSVGEEIRHLFLCVLSRRTICIFCSLNIEMK